MVKRRTSGGRLQRSLRALALLLTFVGGAYLTASVVGPMFGSGLVALAIAFAIGLLVAVFSQLALRIDPAHRGMALDQTGLSHRDLIQSDYPSSRIHACQPRAPPA